MEFHRTPPALPKQQDMFIVTRVLKKTVSVEHQSGLLQGAKVWENTQGAGEGGEASHPPWQPRVHYYNCNYFPIRPTEYLIACAPLHTCAHVVVCALPTYKVSKNKTGVVKPQTHTQSNTRQETRNVQRIFSSIQIPSYTNFNSLQTFQITMLIRICPFPSNHYFFLYKISLDKLPLCSKKQKQKIIKHLM